MARRHLRALLTQDQAIRWRTPASRARRRGWEFVVAWVGERWEGGKLGKGYSCVAMRDPTDREACARLIGDVGMAHKRERT